MRELKTFKGYKISLLGAFHLKSFLKMLTHFCRLNYNEVLFCWKLQQYMRCPSARNVIQKVYLRVRTLFANLPMLHMWKSYDS